MDKNNIEIASDDLVVKSRVQEFAESISKSVDSKIYPFHEEAMRMAIEAMGQFGSTARGGKLGFQMFEELTSNEKEKGNKRNGTFDRQQAFGNIKNLKKQKGEI